MDLAFDFNVIYEEIPQLSNNRSMTQRYCEKKAASQESRQTRAVAPWRARRRALDAARPRRRDGGLRDLRLNDVPQTATHDAVDPHATNTSDACPLYFGSPRATGSTTSRPVVHPENFRFA
jgi:hypothetical protein